MGAAIILGAGDGLGKALAEQFSNAGHTSVIVRRDLDKAEQMAGAICEMGGKAVARNHDVRDPEAMSSLFQSIADEQGSIDVCVYNAGANVQKPLLETSPKLFKQVWELACFGGFLAAQECARHMTPQGKGTLIYTSATAGLMARKGYAAFASAKFGLRAIAQASARELGPLGIHVAHTVIDCGIKTEAIRKRFASRNIDIDDLPEDTLADPQNIAKQYVMLSQQPRDTWTHELDLRPFAETW